VILTGGRRAVAAFVLLLLPGVIYARIPTYADVLKKLPELWAARYPAKVEKFVPDPSHRGLLAADTQTGIVYYFNFQAIVPLPYREGDDLKYRGSRTIELWVQYLPSVDKYDMSFERIDRLPGTGKRWVR